METATQDNAISTVLNALDTLPAIGQPWPGQGGVYVGIRYTPDGPPVHLVGAIGQHEIDSAEWGPAGKRIAGADSYHDGRANTQAMADGGSELAQRVLALDIDGHTDWFLPSQADVHLMAATVKHLMQPKIYWTSTQYSAHDAWYQNFHYGNQGLDDKDCEFRAVPVRTIQIGL
jgi:hypothetical protein